VSSSPKQKRTCHVYARALRRSSRPCLKPSELVLQPVEGETAPSSYKKSSASIAKAAFRFARQELAHLKTLMCLPDCVALYKVTASSAVAFVAPAALQSVQALMRRPNGGVATEAASMLAEVPPDVCFLLASTSSRHCFVQAPEDYAMKKLQCECIDHRTYESLRIPRVLCCFGSARLLLVKERESSLMLSSCSRHLREREHAPWSIFFIFRRGLSLIHALFWSRRSRSWRMGQASAWLARFF
jgi:hypothetical protein